MCDIVKKDTELKKSKLKKSKLKKIFKKKKPYKYGIKEIIKDTGEDIKQMGKDIVDPETYKSVAEGYKMVGSDIVSGVKKYFGKEKTVADPKIKRKKLKRRSVRPEPLDKFTIRKSNHRPLTVKEKTDPRRIKKLKQYQKPLDKHFSREQGPGAPPIPSPQDPKHFKEIPPRFAGGGKALRGLGRAFVKGGKV